MAPSAEPVSTTRVQFDPAGRILVTVYVNDEAHCFVMDTGSRFTTVSAEVATTINRRIQEIHPGVRAVDDVSLRLLGMTLPHQPVRLATEPIPGDGIIGAELCHRFIVKVDFSAGRVTLWPPSAKVDIRHAVVVPADFSHDVPLIAARVSAAGVPESQAELVVSLAVAPRTVSFRYRYAAESGLLDASPGDAPLPIELRGIAKAGIAATAPLPREPEHAPLLFADGAVSARALTESWIVFDAPHARVILGQ